MADERVVALERRVAELEKQVRGLLAAAPYARCAMYQPARSSRDTMLAALLAKVGSGPDATLNAVSAAVQATIDFELPADFKMARIDDPWCKRMRWFSETGKPCLADVRLLPDATFEIAIARVFGEPAVLNVKPSDLFAYANWTASVGVANFKDDKLRELMDFVSSIVKT
jgi:hypothetical protein